MIAAVATAGADHGAAQKRGLRAFLAVTEYLGGCYSQLADTLVDVTPCRAWLGRGETEIRCMFPRAPGPAIRIWEEGFFCFARRDRWVQFRYLRFIPSTGVWNSVGLAGGGGGDELVRAYRRKKKGPRLASRADHFRVDCTRRSSRERRGEEGGEPVRERALRDEVCLPALR